MRYFYTLNNVSNCFDDLDFIKNYYNKINESQIIKLPFIGNFNESNLKCIIMNGNNLFITSNDDFVNHLDDLISKITNSIELINNCKLEYDEICNKYDKYLYDNYWTMNAPKIKNIIDSKNKEIYLSRYKQCEKYLFNNLKNEFKDIIDENITPIIINIFLFIIESDSNNKKLRFRNLNLVSEFS